MTIKKYLSLYFVVKLYQWPRARWPVQQFQLVLKGFSTSLDAGLRASQDVSACSHQLLLLQGVIVHHHSGDQILQGD